MFVAAAEGDGDMINGRGDAYCGMLNCSYNLGMRHLKGYIPEYPVAPPRRSPTRSPSLCRLPAPFLARVI